MERVREGHQVMIFVHSRRETGVLAGAVLAYAQSEGCAGLLRKGVKGEDGKGEGDEYDRVGLKRCSEKGLVQLFTAGLGVHHAGTRHLPQTLETETCTLNPSDLESEITKRWQKKSIPKNPNLRRKTNQTLH